jgi:hypothetical protein
MMGNDRIEEAKMRRVKKTQPRMYCTRTRNFKELLRAFLSMPKTDK